MSHQPPIGPVPQGPAGRFRQPAQSAPPHWAAYGTPGGWAPPPAWAPPPGWGQPGWGQAGWGPGWTPAGRSFHFDWSRLLPTVVVALVIAGVVLGGIGLDNAIAAPSAGTVTVGGSVTITAAPGWVRVDSQDASFSGIELRKANAILTAEVVSTSYSGDSASLLPAQQESLGSEAAQSSYGEAQTTSTNGHDTTYVVFEATVTSDQGMGVIDGELICMVVDGNALVILVAAQQGHLDPVIDDVTAMLLSVGVAR